jgi:hypothetical protein
MSYLNQFLEFSGFIRRSTDRTDRISTEGRRISPPPSGPEPRTGPVPGRSTGLLCDPDLSAEDQAAIELCESWPVGDPVSWRESLEWLGMWTKVVLARETREAESPDKPWRWLLEKTFPEVPDKTAARSPKVSRASGDTLKQSGPRLPFSEDLGP